MATRRKSRSTASVTITDAIANGEALAAKALQSRSKARKSRAVALSKARGAARKGPATLSLAKGGGSAGTLVAEGDSWFDYPRCDVLKALEDEHGYDVESVSHKGDTVEDMAYEGGQLDDFVRRIEKVLRRGEKIRAILLSGGGNDIAGDEFAILLNHARSGAKGLNQKIVEGVIDERIATAYATILSSVTAVCVRLTGSPIRILVHGYDYPVPDGRGFAGGWAFLPGPWLEPGLRRKGYAAITEGKPLMVTLIDHFNAMVRRISSAPAFAHVKYVDLRNSLPTGGTYKDWWANEMHPTKDGFNRIAAKIAAAL